jgi:hypothetical protein
MPMTATAADDQYTAYAVDFATLAREIAQDIFTVDQIVALHRLSDNEWMQIQQHPKFQSMLAEMQRDWNSAGNTRERVRIKAATGLETTLEVFINEINNAQIPLSQRVEAGKFLARLGELGEHAPGVGLGGTINIQIITGKDHIPVEISARAPAPKVIEAVPVDAQ